MLLLVNREVGVLILYVLNSVLFLELILLSLLVFLTQVQDMATLWYLGGLYLFILGFNLLHQGGDI